MTFRAAISELRTLSIPPIRFAETIFQDGVVSDGTGSRGAYEAYWFYPLMNARANNAGMYRKRRPSWILRLTALVVLLAIVWFGWLYFEINAVAAQDEARPADAIAVFGAAEYLGRPSPVLHARLDHAVELYREDIAPWVITLGGGSERDGGMTEGGVGRDYLLANGIPYSHIIAETQSQDTVEQVQDLAEIARQRHWTSIVVVSDGTHLFRIKKLCEDAGLTVYSSPRPAIGHIDDWDMAERYLHEMLSYTAMRLHLNLGWMHDKD